MPQGEHATPRAVAVLETDAHGVQRLIPIALFYERHFYDAALYRATPVPVALAPQTLYEVQQAGKPVGLFTVQSAMQQDGQWAARGRYEAAADSVPRKRIGQASEDPSRPVLHRRPGSDGDDDQAEMKESRSLPVGGNSADITKEAERPRLRRANPAEENGRSNGDTFHAGEVVTRQVAVSDSGNKRAPTELLFHCSAVQEETMRLQARQLALAELKQVAAARGIQEEKLGPPAEEDFHAYQLERNEYTTVVYSARFAPAQGTTQQQRGWVVTVIVRAEGVEFTRIFAAVSDPRELDLYPEIHPVDLVDAEGLGHYLLLLRETAESGIGWRLGRITGFEMQTVFATAER